MVDSREIEDCIEVTKNGFVVKVEAIPNHSESEIYRVNKWRKCIQVRLKSEARNGKANQELLRFFSGMLSLPKSNLNIISGERARSKKLFIEGIDTKTFVGIITDALEAQI
jgi:uncharacterized protein (TIGR00251 family)